MRKRYDFAVLRFIGKITAVEKKCPVLTTSKLFQEYFKVQLICLGLEKKLNYNFFVVAGEHIERCRGGKVNTLKYCVGVLTSQGKVHH